MDARKQLLVVSSGDATSVPSDEQLEKSVYTLLKVEPLSGISNALMGYLDLTMGGVIGKTISKDYAKNHAIKEAMPYMLDLLKSVYRTNTNLILPELQVFRASDIPENLSSVDEHFYVGIVYVAHPAQPNFYIRMADFHQYLIQEKRAEFVKLASALGAKEIRLVEKEKSQRGMSGEVSASVPQVGDSVDLGFHSASGSTIDTNFNIGVQGADVPYGFPKIPSGLKWLKMEPLWATMASARLENWITKYNVTFSYNSDFDINAELSAKILNTGLKCGGTFKAFRSIQQEYEVIFFPKDRYSEVSS